MRLRERLAKLEAAHTTVPTAEESLFALERLTSPPAGYTDTDRRMDEASLRAWEAAAIAAGLG